MQYERQCCLDADADSDVCDNRALLLDQFAWHRTSTHFSDALQQSIQTINKMNFREIVNSIHFVVSGNTKFDSVENSALMIHA